jgi:hypothetical protein
MPSMDWQKNCFCHDFIRIPDKKIQDYHLVFLLVLPFPFLSAKLLRYGN